MSSNNVSIIDLVLIVCILAALVATVRVCAKDAMRRGRSPVWVSLMVILFFPLGFLVWLALRPPIIETDKRKS